jgi:hypothetical protein
VTSLRLTVCGPRAGLLLAAAASPAEISHAYPRRRDWGQLPRRPAPGPFPGRRATVTATVVTPWRFNLNSGPVRSSFKVSRHGLQSAPRPAVALSGSCESESRQRLRTRDRDAATNLNCMPVARTCLSDSESESE